MRACTMNKMRFCECADEAPTRTRPAIDWIRCSRGLLGRSKLAEDAIWRQPRLKAQLLGVKTPEIERLLSEIEQRVKNGTN